MTIFERADAELLPGFQRRSIQLEGGQVMALTAGDGPPLLMLHGDPQTHLCWHLIAPALTDRFTIVLTDLRGRGETHKPPVGTHGEAYSKRAMAAEQRAVMQTLGFDRFALVAHDRGARVARRLALDHPEVVEKLVVMDIIPALDFYEALNAQIAQAYFYFCFLTQPSPAPERLIGGDPAGFMRSMVMGLSDAPVAYHPTALEAYMASNTAPEAIIAMCECFRAGFHIDRRHDAEDRVQGKRIACPTLVMWGEKNILDQCFDIREIWRG